MSDRYSADSSTRIWDHLNELDQDRIDLAADVSRTTGGGDTGSYQVGDKLVQFGTVTINTVNSTSGETAVTFPIVFASGSVNIQLTLTGAGPFAPHSAGITASGFTAVMRHVDNTNSTASRVVHWHATGSAPAA